MLNVDRVPSAESSSPDSPAPFLLRRPHRLRRRRVEALGNAEKLPGIEAVVHLAAIPSPVHATPDLTFRTNITSTHTVFSAAARLGLKRVVWASSETTLGLPFDTPPDYAPGRRGARAAPGVLLRALEGPRRGDGAPVPPLERASRSWACASRTSWSAHDYERFPGFWDDPQLRKWNLWGYVDESHVAQSVPAARWRPTSPAPTRSSSPPRDTVMKRPSRELMAEVFPGVPVRDGVEGTDTLLSIDKARRVLGYSPDFTWRELF